VGKTFVISSDNNITFIRKLQQ